VDLYETADAYVLTAEIPGVDRDDIDIQTGDGRLTLSGTRRERPTWRASSSTASSAATGRSSARSSCRFRSTTAAVTADLKDGVLTVRCPKLPGPSTRRIAITP
jgi:HSP20 family protein